MLQQKPSSLFAPTSAPALSESEDEQTPPHLSHPTIQQTDFQMSFTIMTHLKTTSIYIHDLMEVIHIELAYEGGHV